ncbi:MAG: DUF2202 domain-containing protein [Anaerolineales bacterium]|nr:DUF2202 domain-containing protein [Anaerolineales bacterium]
MLKKILIGTFAAILIVAVGASAYHGLAASPTQPEVVQRDPPAGMAAVQNVAPAVVAGDVLVAAATGLTADETAGLLFMYEEEKLARDVYNALYAVWGQPTFQTIAASEQSHMDSIGTLLERYSLPVPDLAPGIFADPSLQALYTDLVNRGGLSLGEALKVGAAIEEIDILDLQTHLAQTTNLAIQQAYTSLITGSYNHLRNFVSVLNRQTGEVYQPQFLSADLYQTIVSGVNAVGQGASSGGGGGRGYRGGRP